MQVFARNGGRRATRQLRNRPHAQIRDGVRVANLRAFTAARFYLDKIANKQLVTLKEAARCHGTNVPYIQAAIMVLKANDQHLVGRILSGERLLAVAKLLTPQIKLAELLADASPAARTAASRAFGHPDLIWDDMVAPLINAAQ
jgi:hypothetical protein